ncbi:MAG: hypothetical protein K2X27_17070, partial [Candidatus Obscuribacterales bacterium]|nr:hypothetical protein [Candidatus Obscuribacterales bacterium]
KYEIMDSLPCKYKVGFLFKRVCGRLSREGCKYCKGVPLAPGTQLSGPEYDPYFRDRSLYYNDNYYANRYDFTDYDAASLDQESDTDYESDLDAS